MSALFRATGDSGFDRLYRRHATSVYRYVYAVLGNHSDAEDVTQQTFLNAYRAIAGGTTPRKAENWLVTIAHNELRRHFRKTHGRALEVELDEELAQPAPERSDPSLADVLRALQHLPPAQRAALVMREFEGRSYAEMAQILDVTQDTLEGLIFRGRRALAEQLEGALTCPEAEEALMRRLDTRLARREARRLRDHLRECPTCVRFETVQKRQRSLLKGLSVLPIPASLYVFRGEQAALAAGLGGGTAAGGTAALGGGGAAAAAAAGASGLVVKAAAVVASAAVVGGVGYGVTAGSATTAAAEPKVSHVAAVDETRLGRRAEEVKVALARGERPGPARPANARARRITAAQTRPAPASRARRAKNDVGRARGHETAARAAKESSRSLGRPAKSPAVAARRERGRSPAAPKRAEPNRARAPSSKAKRAGAKSPPADQAPSPPSASANGGNAAEAPGRELRPELPK
ncbi:MAG TPA: sigma-70 family RNA polymerase sigma factor [Gaiellaceae bacterium]|nr:sigma-70 family RNA polymerase sigma factor [Gaiellaceae bacterium]